MIDTHAHLEPDEAEEVLGRARAAGVDRVLVVATRLEGAREALALAAAYDGVHAILGIHPHNADEPDAARLDELRELLRSDRAVAVGETGLDYFREYASRDEQQRLFEGKLAPSPMTSGMPVVIHTRAADDDTLAALASFPGTVVLHCFSSPALLPTALERGWYVSFAGNVTYPKAPELREAAKQVPGDRILAETDSPYLAPRSLRCVAGKRARERRPHPRRPRGGPEAKTPARTRDPDRRERHCGLPSVTVVPKKQLGQHFLVDENILGVIGRLAELEPDDVVLEIGPGLGALTRYLADRVAYVHAVEIDRSLETSLGGITRATVHWGDALQLDLAGFEPAPAKLVANLPYNIATPLVVESLDLLASVALWCA